VLKTVLRKAASESISADRRKRPCGDSRFFCFGADAFQFARDQHRGAHGPRGAEHRLADAWHLSTRWKRPGSPPRLSSSTTILATASRPECSALAHAYDVRLIVRHGGRGLATAVLNGFVAARASVLVCMDADLSHPPEAITPRC
jgi:hypothetical protein